MINRLNNSLRHLLDSIDLNSRYNLRHTDERRERIINALDLHTTTPTHNTMPEQTVLMAMTSSSTPKQQQQHQQHTVRRYIVVLFTTLHQDSVGMSL